MRVVLQRVKTAAVKVENEMVGKIGPGILVFLGVGRKDSEKDCAYLAEKIPNLRIFEDPSGLMNLSLMDTKGSVLVVSQFTLWGDTRKGRRPSFVAAAPPDTANRLYELFVDQLKQKGLHVETGRFQTSMDVSLINDGPVTLILDSGKNY